MVYSALVRDKNPMANSRWASGYDGAGATPCVFFDAGKSAIMGGAAWDDGAGGEVMIPYYEPAIEAAGARTVPDLDLITALDWLGNSTVRVHVAIAHGASANTAPTTPLTPTGLAELVTDQVVEFETEATDAEGNLLYFMWDWGDGDVSDWLGPFDEGTKVNASHSYAVVASYDIKVMTKDPFGEETVWSAVLPVSVTPATCCVDRVGDANGLGGDEPTIGDVSVMIDAKFISGSCDGIIDCLFEADINQSAAAAPTCDDVTIGDISILIDYLFITGLSLGMPDCL